MFRLESQAMNGSGGDRGYDYQADAYAYIVAHGLAGQPLAWFDDIEDVPCSFAMETGGAGDDLRFWNRAGVPFEVQAKHALRNDAKFTAAVMRLLVGLRDQTMSRGVLFVDRHASEIIRDDFRRDVIRFGQGRTDGLSGIFRQVQTAAHAAGHGGAKLFRRLRVIVVDLDDGSDGLAAARALLANVVPPEHTPAAFRLLGKQGHSLTKGRGQQNVDAVAARLDREIGLADAGDSPAILWHRYRAWLGKVTADFFCTALEDRFPIEQAWDRVREFSESAPSVPSGEDRLAREIERYHEWQRLARDGTSSDARAADAYVIFTRRSAIIGGPGSGKSTLATRLANALLARGDSVFRVRLAVVQGLLNQGQTFDDAIALAAIDRSGLSPAEARKLGFPQWLIADGLDECDPARADMAERITEWADGHPASGLCILTRPVGHTPEFLPGFRHAELLPLDEAGVRERSRWFSDAVSQDKSGSDALCARLEQGLAGTGTRSAATLAARNPLILGFLVRLTADGQPLQANRFELLTKIIDRMHRTPPAHREGEALAAAVAMRSIDAIGFSVLERPTRQVHDVMRQVAKEFGDGVTAEQTAERAIAFWEQRGLIERLTAGSLDAVTFIHPLLGEHAAGRHLSRLEREPLRELVVANRRSPRWREPLLHAAATGAADTIIEALLENDDPSDPASQELMLAGEVAQVAQIDDRFLAEVVKRLCNRLNSPIPIIAVEAGTALADLTPAANELILEGVGGYTHHGQPWTQAVALAVSIVAEAKYLSTEQVLEWVQRYAAAGSNMGWNQGRIQLAHEASRLRSQALVHATKRLLRDLPPDETKRVVQRLLREGSISVHDYRLVAEVMRLAGHADWVSEVDIWSQSAQGFIESVVAGREKSLSASQYILECVVSACRPEDSDSQTGSKGTYINVGKLMEAMGVWGLPLPEWHFLAKRGDAEVIVEVIRGAIAALALDPAKVAGEAGDLLRRTEQDAETLFGLPRGPVEPDWSRTGGAGLDWNKIAAALYSPCQLISLTAARLIDASGMAGDLSGEVERVLHDGTGISLHLVGALAKATWGENAFAVLQKRLKEPLVPGCEYLFKWLVQSASAEQIGSACGCILEGMSCEDSQIAFGAAEQLESIADEVLGLHVAQLNDLLKHWDTRGSWCRRCKRRVTGSSCPGCSVIPRDPRSPVVKALARANGLPVDRLMELLQHPRHDVVEATADALAAAAAEDRTVMAHLVEAIRNGAVALPVWRAILKLPNETLGTHSDALLSLLESEDASVRAQVVSSLPSQWVARERALSLARAALTDKSPVVRNSATTALRALLQRSDA